ncbi:MAG: methionine--tRNA ligase [Candidatus Kapaibacteriales bacterium]
MENNNENSGERYLLTSALPYANGYLHLGHCAGAYLPADIFARFLRLNGKPVIWVCGSDEHGVAITIASEKEGKTPKEIIDHYHEANKVAFERFAISFDIYSRTSLPIHYDTAREFFADFLRKGYLIEKEEEQFYDPIANMFLPDRYVEGVCPNCGFSQARGDQCDNCGAYYNQLELISPKSLVSGQKPIVRKTTHWYFTFDHFQTFLENYIESHSTNWKENVLQQTRGWLRQGLKERAVTRDLNWGIPIEGIEGIPREKARGKVIYVWFEAVLGYISATKHLFKSLSEKNLANPEDWEQWWKNPATHYIAFIGKDNIVFHTLLFPSMLYAKNQQYILPENVPANEFLNLEGEKFSKSRNWSIDLKDFLADFDFENYIDSLRYTLASNLPETKDSDFTWRDFQARNNNELAAIFGNFINRTIQFLHKYFGGKVPKLSAKYSNIDTIWQTLINDILTNSGLNQENYTPLNENDIELAKGLVKAFTFTTTYLKKFRFRDAVNEIMHSARLANKYFNDEAPWKTFKENNEISAKTIYICSQLVYSFAFLFSPILPYTCKKIFKAFNKVVQVGEPNYGKASEDLWSKLLYFQIQEGTPVQKIEILFPIIDDKVIEKQTIKLGKSQEQLQAELKKETVEYEEFAKIKLRIARVIDAEKITKSKKLIRLKVDLGGGEIRQIVAGIGEHYSPDKLLDKTIVVVSNLAPTKLMGVESQGMLLAASTADGSKLSLVTTLDPEIPPGSIVK